MMSIDKINIDPFNVFCRLSALMALSFIVVLYGDVLTQISLYNSAKRGEQLSRKGGLGSPP